jgi:hypothetical protein
MRAASFEQELGGHRSLPSSEVDFYNSEKTKFGVGLTRVKISLVN